MSKLIVDSGANPSTTVNVFVEDESGQRIKLGGIWSISFTTNGIEIVICTESELASDMAWAMVAEIPNVTIVPKCSSN